MSPLIQNRIELYISIFKILKEIADKPKIRNKTIIKKFDQFDFPFKSLCFYINQLIESSQYKVTKKENFYRVKYFDELHVNPIDFEQCIKQLEYLKSESSAILNVNFFERYFCRKHNIRR